MTRQPPRVLLATIQRVIISLALLICAATAVPAASKSPLRGMEQIAEAASSAPNTPAETAPPSDPTDALDAIKQGLDQTEAKLKSDSMTDSELARLRAALDPLSEQIQTVIADVSPKLAALKARLDQLGPAPDPKANPPAAPEDPAVSQERADQQKFYAANGDLIKRANDSQLRLDQIAARIADRRRTLFADAVFQSSSSILAPNLWADVAGDAPKGFAATRGVFADLVGQFVQALSGIFVLALAGLLVALLVATLVARRVIPREKSGRPPSELQKAAAALWTALAVAAIPIGGAAGFYLMANWFGLGAQEFKPLSDAFFRGVVHFALAIGLGNAILAPSRPMWRPVDLTDRVAQRLMNLVLILLVLVTFDKLFEALNEVVGASLQLTIAARGVFSLLVGLTLVRGLYGIVAPAQEGESESGRSVTLEDESPWWPPIRFAAWAATAAVIGADLIGYIALASFIVDQIAWTAFVAALLFLLLKLVSEGLERAFRPGSRLSRALVNSVGLRRESLAQIGVLLSGAVTLTLYCIAAMLIMAPWGLQSHDMIGAMESAFFGFKLGDVTISPWSLVIALVLFGVGYAITHAIQSWLEKRYLPLTQIDQGLKASIRTSIGYIGVLLSLLFAVAFLGINLEKLALVAGALSVGIGLGLQSVVNNFVSGLILLWERAIRVGDLVTIGEDQGYVRRINVRATEIETFDRATTIVPNGNMVTGVVKNFVRGDRVGRVKIPLQVVWGADPEKVRETLLDVARSHEEVVGIPAATVLFTSLGAGWLNFDLICFVEEVERAVRVKSDLLYAIFSRFAQEGILLTPTAPPTTNTNVRFDSDQIEPWLKRFVGTQQDIRS